MSDIDAAEVDSLKVLDPERPIREADKGGFWPAMACQLLTHKRNCSEPHVCCRLISAKFHARFRERSPYESAGPD